MDERPLIEQADEYIAARLAGAAWRARLQAGREGVYRHGELDPRLAAEREWEQAHGLNTVETKDEPPTTWIHWKGTNVCMDIWCTCGAQAHADAEFLYFVKCAACGQVYWVGQVVTLNPLSPAQVAYLDAKSRRQLGGGFEPTEVS